MATINSFDSFGDDDAEEPSLLIAAQTQPQVKQIPNLTSKPLPPAQAVNGTPRGGFINGEVGDKECPRRHSGTGRRNEIKREGAVRWNWFSKTYELAQVAKEIVNKGEKNLVDEKPAREEEVADAKENPTNEPEEKEPEDKEMTLEEYEKVLEEKRKPLQVLQTEERKVDARAFEAMQRLSSKKAGDEVFIKLGSSDKDKRKKKKALEKGEQAKKSEFLKAAEGEKYYCPGRGGRGTQRWWYAEGGDDDGDDDGYYYCYLRRSFTSLELNDHLQFPSLGADLTILGFRSPQV